MSYRGMRHFTSWVNTSCIDAKAFFYSKMNDLIVTLGRFEPWWARTGARVTRFVTKLL